MRAGARARDAVSGRTVGEFIIGERIGEGGHGAVYRSEQQALGRPAVVKVLHQRLRHNEAVVRRFLREAKLASRLDHPYAAHIYAFGIEIDGLFWIAMEMVHGTTLARWLDERGPLAPEQLIPLFERIAEVVQCAHDAGIVHRDLKPSNVMVIERAGRLLPKLLDFGVAKLVGTSAPRDALAPTLSPHSSTQPVLDDTTAAQEASPSPSVALDGFVTDPNATIGSPAYMPPEQWQEPLAVGPRSDLYSDAGVFDCGAGRRSGGVLDRAATSTSSARTRRG
jgi:serine/threonine protein kinase